MRVLIADDSQQARNYAHQILRSAGHMVVETVGSGEDLVAAARREAVDIAIIDVNMPGKGGVWAARALRTENLVPHIVVATSNTQAVIMSELDAIGGVGKVGKPFVRHQLLAELAHNIPGFTDTQKR